MSTLASLQARINRIQEYINIQHAPKTWMLVQEEGLNIPDALEQQLGPEDKIVIMETPRGYLGELENGPVFYPISGHKGRR